MYFALKTYKSFSFVIDDIWSVFEATEVLPTHKDAIFLTVDDAYQAARDDLEKKHDGTENGSDKVRIH